jgi:hypothetical protein
MTQASKGCKFLGQTNWPRRVLLCLVPDTICQTSRKASRDPKICPKPRSFSAAATSRIGLVPGLQAEVFRNASSQPFGKGIERAARQQEVGNQDAERNVSGDIFGPLGAGRQVTCEERLELEAFQEAADDRYTCGFVSRP